MRSREEFDNLETAVIGAGNAGVLTIMHLLVKQEFRNITWYYDSTKPPVSVGEGSTIPQTQLIASVLKFPNELVRQEFRGSAKMGIDKINWGNGDFMHEFPTGQHAIHFSANIMQDWFINNFEDDRLKKVDIQNLNPDDIKADFIFDCSGKPKELDDKFEIVDTIPVNCAYIQQVPQTEKYPAFDKTYCIARPFGWVFIIPLQDRYSIGYIYNKNINTEQEIAKDIENVYQYVPSVKNISEGKVMPFDNYYRKENFKSNYVYNGNASFFMEPLEATSSFNIVQINIFATEQFHRPYSERKYNKQFSLEMLKNEFLINFHYMVGSKWKNDFWNEAYKKSMITLDKFKEMGFGNVLNNIIAHTDMLNETKFFNKDAYRTIGQWPYASWVHHLRGFKIEDTIKDIWKLN